MSPTLYELATLGGLVLGSGVSWALRHGTELIPAREFKAPIPVQFQDEPKFMVFRYDGKLPMAGIRVHDVFHVLWIEPEFNRLYDHGSS